VRWKSSRPRRPRATIRRLSARSTQRYIYYPRISAPSPRRQRCLRPVQRQTTRRRGPTRSGASWQHPLAPAAWPTQGRHAARTRGRPRTLLRPVDRDQALGDPPCSSGSPCPSVPSGGVLSPLVTASRPAPAAATGPYGKQGSASAISTSCGIRVSARTGYRSASRSAHPRRRQRIQHCPLHSEAKRAGRTLSSTSDETASSVDRAASRRADDGRPAARRERPDAHQIDPLCRSTASIHGAEGCSQDPRCRPGQALAGRPPRGGVRYREKPFVRHASVRGASGVRRARWTRFVHRGSHRADRCRQRCRRVHG